jgi:hypothetical protein
MRFCSGMLGFKKLKVLPEKGSAAYEFINP